MCLQYISNIKIIEKGAYLNITMDAILRRFATVSGCMFNKPGQANLAQTEALLCSTDRPNCFWETATANPRSTYGVPVAL